ncbi:MAG: GC-type dockerin domain-anchored protein [Planctomycetota bacterium]
MQTISLSGSDADGYLATVSINQEGNQTLADISRDPMDAKFFDYPAYVNPVTPENIVILIVEPYRFGLTYPDPLHPSGPGVFQPVGPLRPASEASLPGVTFIEAVTEDADFADFAIGVIEFDDGLVGGVGVEVVPPSELALLLDGSEFESTNRTELIAGADTPPFGLDGRSNRNEAANTVAITVNDKSGAGATFTDGVLTSLDFIADVSVDATGSAFPPGFGLVVDGELAFSGGTFAFNVDGQDSTPFASNVRLVLNRTGTIDAVGVFSVNPCLADLTTDGAGNGMPDGVVTLSDFSFYLTLWSMGDARADITPTGTCDAGNGDSVVDLSDFSCYLTDWSAGCP